MFKWGDHCVYLRHLYTKHSDAKIYTQRQKLKILFGHVVHIFKEDKQELVLTSRSEPAEAQAVLLHLLKGDLSSVEISKASVLRDKRCFE